jgi:hypothetical protein
MPTVTRTLVNDGLPARRDKADAVTLSLQQGRPEDVISMR